MADAAFRLLTQGEIEVLRYLVWHVAHAQPITLPASLRRSVPALWRMGLVDVWFKRFPHDEPQAIGSYFTLSAAGWRRAQPFLFGRDGAPLPFSFRRAPRGPHDAEHRGATPTGARSSIHPLVPAYRGKNQRS